MNLSNLLQDNHHSSKRSTKTSSSGTQRTAQSSNSYGRDMASVLTATSFQNQYARAPQPPLSPPSEDSSGCTLPSIQSLIGMANAPNHEQQGIFLSHVGRHPTNSHLTSAAAELERQPAQSQHQQHGDGPPSADHRSQAYGQPTVSPPIALPPSPPLRPDFDFDGSTQSPSAASSHSSSAPVPYFTSSINENDPHHQQRPRPTSSSHSGTPISPQQQPPGQSPYQALHYPSSPASLSNYSYPSPANQSGTPVIYYQRSLPSNFPASHHHSPPDIINPALSNSHERSPIESGGNPWQHHHYIAPSSTASIAVQPADRYICQTCSKSFSRPSSLRIHSYSHTGEKPFKCAHDGCGKAFSVRSNMKRHERGCHGGESPGSA